jgi:uncharacterized protein YecT (DUF1311 family)
MTPVAIVEGLHMRLLSPMLFACLAFAPAALAYDCADQTQPGLDQCADAAFKRADAALNGVYREITRSLKDDPKTTKLLVATQKAWIAFRDSECAFSVSANEGGSIYPMVYSLCLAEVTKARTKRLEAYLKCTDDTGCPVSGQ